MAGIYIHIPFCRQKCYYCDFYKSLNTSLTSSFLISLKKEVLLQKEYLGGEWIETIYFGGGTPSVLTDKELYEIMNFIFNEFEVSPNAEITFEANPDDLSFLYLKELKNAGINRLSIGIQSFQEKHLKKMNRRHNALQAITATENAAKAGFTNLSVDLIYGLPDLSEKEWKSDLKQIFQLPVQHLSAYHLTYHKGTPFYTWLKNGALKELQESASIDQFNLLLDTAESNGFEHYEISNFAKAQLYSKHNTSYWTGKKYLGIGPSAHSFNGDSRQWNIANVEAYTNAIEKGTSWFEKEILTENDRFNEYILTRIRTKWGVSLIEIEKQFGKQKLDHFLKAIERYKISDRAVEQNKILTLSREGLFVSDEIMSHLMVI